MFPKFVPVMFTVEVVAVFVAVLPVPRLPKIFIFPTLFPVGIFVQVVVFPVKVQA